MFNRFRVCAISLSLALGACSHKEEEQQKKAAEILRKALSGTSNLVVSDGGVAQSLLGQLVSSSSGSQTSGVRRAVSAAKPPPLLVGCVDPNGDIFKGWLNAHVDAIVAGEGTVTAASALSIVPFGSAQANEANRQSGVAWHTGSAAGLNQLVFCPPAAQASDIPAVDPVCSLPPSATPLPVAAAGRLAVSEATDGRVVPITGLPGGPSPLGYSVIAGKCPGCEGLPSNNGGDLGHNHGTGVNGFFQDGSPNLRCFVNLDDDCPNCAGNADKWCADLVELHQCGDVCVVVNIGSHQDRYHNGTNTCDNGCFSGDTSIRMADQSEKKVRNIQKGDLVWNPIRKKAFRVRKIALGMEQEGTYEIRAGELRLTVTRVHPVLTSRGVVMAEKLVQGDFALGTDGKPKLIQSIRFVAGAGVKTYNFEVESASSDPMDHVVLANGMATADLKVQGDLIRARAKQEGKSLAGK